MQLDTHDKRLTSQKRAQTQSICLITGENIEKSTRYPMNGFVYNGT